MRVDNLRWHPIRLSMRRVRSGTWWISRAGKVVGELEHRDGAWRVGRGREVMNDDGRNVMVFNSPGKREFPGFRAAALWISRLRHVTPSSDGPQGFGKVGMLRVCVSSQWYTVITTGSDRYIYEDHTIGDGLSDEEQAVLRKVLTEVGRALGESFTMKGRC